MPGFKDFGAFRELDTLLDKIESEQQSNIIEEESDDYTCLIKKPQNFLKDIESPSESVASTPNVHTDDKFAVKIIRSVDQEY